MGNKIAAYFEVRRSMAGESGFAITARLKNITIARIAFWATVNEYHAELRPGDVLYLFHGARIVLQYPPKPTSGKDNAENC